MRGLWCHPAQEGGTMSVDDVVGGLIVVSIFLFFMVI
jgi:hypothetical protein